MHYIKDVFEKKVTEHAHNKFTRYSKGVFQGPLIKIKISKTGTKISGSFHFIDELLYFVAKAIGNKVVFVKGSLVWNTDLAPELAKLGIKYSKVSKSRGIFKYDLENDVNIADFVKYMSKYYVLLTVKDGEVSFATKSSFPKPNKEFTNDFCKATFPASISKEVLKEFAFDVDDSKAKTIDITHKIIIEDIVIPKDAKDFEAARKLALRKGTLERTVIVDDGEPKVVKIPINV